jgi:hypothetical protein
MIRKRRAHASGQNEGRRQGRRVAGRKRLFERNVEQSISYNLIVHALFRKRSVRDFQRA